MKRALSLLFFVAASSAFAADVEVLLSPSGRLSVTADLLRGEITPFVRLVFVKTTSRKEHLVYSEASAKWAIAWSPNDALILVTSPNDAEWRVRVFEVKDRSFAERDASEFEKTIAHKAYAKKFSEKEPNQQSSQRNTGSRPSSGDSSASETPSSLGPRG
jgi:hypothetical protein